MTAATWMRNFIRAHPQYHADSVITPQIARDLIQACDEVAHKKRQVGEVKSQLKSFLNSISLMIRFGI